MDPELQAVQDAIDALHQLMTVLSDPKDTQIVSKCLTALTGVQQDMMQNRGAGSSPQDALMAQLQGGPAGALQGAGGGGGAVPQY